MHSISTTTSSGVILVVLISTGLNARNLPTNSWVASSISCDRESLASKESTAPRWAEVYAQFNCYGIWKSADYGLTWKGPPIG